MERSSISVRSIATGVPEAPSLIASAIAFLRTHEAENSIQLGVYLTVDLDGATLPLMIVALNEDAVIAVASMTQPFNLLLSHQVDDRAGRTIAEHLTNAGVRIPGVMGAVNVVGPFADAWTKLTGATRREGMRQRILACSSVVGPEDVPGTFRLAQETDRPTVEQWFVDFFVEADEATPAEARSRAESMLRRLRSPAGCGIWEATTGELVAAAGFKDPSGSTMRIGPVFVPPDRRGHGYGKAVTAGTTRHILDSGCAEACLYTDAANPVANHVYEAIGYQPLADSRIVRFRYDEP